MRAMTHRPGSRLRIAVPLLLIIGIAVWAGLASMRRLRTLPDVVEATGTIEATQVAIASTIPGRIARLHAVEGQTVQAGAALVELEGRELSAQLDQSRAAVAASRARLAQAQAALALQRRQVGAQIAHARAALDAARARVEQAEESEQLTASQARLSVAQAEAVFQTARANRDAAEAQLDRTAQDLARSEALFREGAIGAQQVDGTRAAHRAAQAQYDAAQRAVQQAEAALGIARENRRQVQIRTQEIGATRAQYRQAQAQLDLALAGEEAIAQRRADVEAAAAAVGQAEAGVRVLHAQQENLFVRAPRTGTVVAVHAQEGEIVGASAPILTIAYLDSVWVRVFLPLPRLGQIRLGSTAEVTTEAASGQVFTGTISEISQQAEFTPKNVQTAEERVKLVFSVKITIANSGNVLKPGMPATARIRGNAGTR
ncbi:MAG: efflux RND transporter periplasmic adaptor subunit [Armatimonadetes bacterium]|nr:efflux RND transporter periplasmic adaptor subunit [Armatimonadota bacterium]